MTDSLPPQAAPSPVPWLRWLAVALWMGLIFYGSSRSDSGVQSLTITARAFQALGVHTTPQVLAASDHLVRKAAHLTEYAILGVLLGRALTLGGPRRPVAAWALATLYAATDEFHQRFVPTRGPSVTDVGIDSVGAWIGLTLAWVTTWRRQQR